MFKNSTNPYQNQKVILLIPPILFTYILWNNKLPPFDNNINSLLPLHTNTDKWDFKHRESLLNRIRKGNLFSGLFEY